MTRQCKCVDEDRQKRCMANADGPDGYCSYCRRMYPCDHARMEGRIAR
jgi:hypothetical protein